MTYYLIQVEECVEPVLHGPFDTEKEMDNQCAELFLDASYSSEQPDDVFIPMEIDFKKKTVELFTYPGSFFDDLVEDEEAEEFQG